MTDIEQLIRSAADNAPAGHGMLAAAHRVARRERRRRAVATVTLAAVAVAGVVSLVSWPQQRTAVTPATAAESTESPAVSVTKPAPSAVPSTPGCGTGSARAVPATAISEQVGLLSSDPTYRLVGPPNSRMVRSTCAQPAIPLVLRAVDSGVVRRAVTVTGPMTQQERAMVPWPQGAPMNPLHVSHPVVRGVNADLTVHPDNSIALGWVDADDKSWLVQASGMTEVEVQDFTEALVIGATVSVDPGRVPGDLVELAPHPAGSTAEFPVWIATYRAPGLEFVLQVGLESPRFSWAGEKGADGDRLITVRGHEGLIHVTAGGAYMRWDEKPGVTASVSSMGATQADLERFASSLEFAASDDPRLARG